MMRFCSEYIGVWSTMSFTLSTDNGYSCVMGNRNVQPKTNEHSTVDLSDDINLAKQTLTSQSNNCLTNILSSSKQDQDLDCLRSRSVATTCNVFSCHKSELRSATCSSFLINVQTKDDQPQRVPGLRSYTPIPFESIVKEDLLKSQGTYCIVHPANRLQIYCNPCQVSVCVTCHALKHIEHDCKDITDTFNLSGTSRCCNTLDTNLVMSSEKCLPWSGLSQFRKDFVKEVSGCTESRVDMSRVVASEAHQTCTQNAEPSISKCSSSNKDLRENVVGLYYKIENTDCVSKDSGATVRKYECDESQFTTGKRYTLTKEDGSIVDGIFDGKYLLVEEASCSRNCVVSTSSVCSSAENQSNANSTNAHSAATKNTSEEISDIDTGTSVLTGCHVKLDRLPACNVKISRNLNKPKQIQFSKDLSFNQALEISQNIDVHDNSTFSPSKQLPRLPVTVINIDHDDNDEDIDTMEKISSSMAKPSSTIIGRLGASINHSEIEDFSKVNAEIIVETAKFRGCSWNSVKVSFCQQRILLSTDSESLIFSVLDISSIKFDVSSNPQMFSNICIQVRPSFEAELLTARAVPGHSSDLKLFLKIKPSELDSLQTAIQILCSQLPEANEVSSAVALELECQPNIEATESHCLVSKKRPFPRMAVDCRAPLHKVVRRAESNSFPSEALQALREYDDCDMDSELAEQADVSDSRSILVSNLFTAEIVKLFIYPPPPAVGGITVTNQDLFCLNDGEFLNDVIIEFYIKYLQAELLTSDQRTRTHIFNTFFYGQLTKETKDASCGLSLQQRRHSRVKRWTKHVDLFSKDFIIIPINEDSHWFLAIICFPNLVGVSSRKTSKTSSKQPTKQGHCHQSSQAVESLSTDSIDEDKKQPCILIFDSLKGSTNRWAVAVILREYLQVEWDLKKAHTEGSKMFEKSSMKGATPGCPQQSNSSDCGIYVLHYIENFFKRPLRDFILPIRYLNDWFLQTEIATKRRDLRTLILTMLRTLNPSLNYNPVLDGCDDDCGS